MLGSSSLKKLKIEGFDKDSYSGTAASTFEAMINPESYKHSVSINYTEQKFLGASYTNQLFNRVNSEELSFTIILDDTGAIPRHTANEDKTVSEMIDLLKETVYDYDGTIHEPNYAKITWGDGLTFNGRLTQMTLDHKLFKPDGAPLRVSIDLTFKTHKNPKEGNAEAGNNSPDMTHLVVVKVGDTLPYLCDKIYGQSKYYLHIAKFNKLANFRQLTPGDQLIFPPLI